MKNKNIINNQQVTFMGNLMNFVGFLSLAACQKLAHDIFFLATMLIEDLNNCKQFVFFSHLKSNIQSHFSFYEEITRMRWFAVNMAFFKSADKFSMLAFSICLLKFSTVCQLLQLLKKKCFAFMADFHPIFKPLIK